MKLRIRGNSIRIRVSQSELAQIAEEGFAEDAIAFMPGSRLTYRVDVAGGERIEARFEGNRITVALPKTAVDRWIGPEEVSIRSRQPLGDGGHLTILVEKDFACLTPREDEDQSDLFPNPEERSCG